MAGWHVLAAAVRQAWTGAVGRRAAAHNDTLVLNNGRNDGPPDLDELWRDFNRKLGGLIGGRPGGSAPRPPETGGGGDPGPSDRRIAGIGGGLIVGVVALLWLGSGFFIVQEGQQAVIMTFGLYAGAIQGVSNLGIHVEVMPAVITSVVVLALALLTSLVAVRRVLRLDPLSATTGAGIAL